MAHRLVTQPMVGGYDLLDFFEQAAILPGAKRVQVVSAWVNSTGVRLIAPYISSMQAAGAQCRAVVGVSRGGTSFQGLDALMTLIPDTYVFHAAGRTFHPKLYAVDTGSQALTLVGSHNLTGGGSRLNFEAGIHADLDLSDPDDRRFLDEIDGYVSMLVAPASPSIRLDAQALAELKGVPGLLYDETVGASGGASGGTSGSTGDGSLFPPTPFSMRGLPATGSGASSGAGGSASGSSGSGAAGTQSAGAPASSGPPSGRPDARWHKVLGKTDAQQGDTAQWNPSNTLTLVNGANTATYFREQLFAGLAWSPTVSRGAKSREVVSVTMEVVSHGTSLGRHRFELRYTPDYDSDQSNRTTELQWGTLAGHMRAVDHSGEYVTIERHPDGTFLMHFTATPRGPKIP